VRDEREAVTQIRGPVLAIHGGAGALRRDIQGDPVLLEGRCAGLRRALAAGWRILSAGGPALDAVQAAVEELEDDPHFNAGRGASLDELGRVRLDASIMCGRERRAGALCAAERLRHPVAGARRLLEEGLVLAEGREVEERLCRAGLEGMPPGWFVTPARRAQLEAALAAGETRLDHSGESAAAGRTGTVGAAARDAAGHLAAATSTGGMTAKRAGRIGDSPVIGAGTWADDRSLALSATGMGEAFLRTAFAKEVADRLLLAGQSLGEACAAALAEVSALGGEGGCAAVDRFGRVALPFSSAGMYRGWTDIAAGRWRLAIFEEAVLQEGPLEDLSGEGGA
jgi:L-asparaginase / beta-aspartyl-peptidase